MGQPDPGQVNIYRRSAVSSRSPTRPARGIRLNDKIATCRSVRGLAPRREARDGRRPARLRRHLRLRPRFFHNAKNRRHAAPARSTLPKMESHLEARLGTTSSFMAQEHSAAAARSSRPPVLVETILAAFEMERSSTSCANTPPASTPDAGTTFSAASRNSRRTRTSAPANRGCDHDEVPFMRAYALLVKTCTTAATSAAPAMGGMRRRSRSRTTRSPTKGARRHPPRQAARANDGHDGGWVASGLSRSPPRNSQPCRPRPEPMGEATRRRCRQGRFQLPARAADHRNRPAQQHQRRHPLPRQLAAGNGCADPQPDGRRGDRRDFARRSGKWVVSPKGILDDGRKVTPRWFGR